MVDLSGISGVLGKFAYTWAFWLILGTALITVSFGSLWLRKKAKFHFGTIILTDNGNGKVGMTLTRAGWFRSKKILGGLLDVSGERRLEVKDGRIVQQGSSADFHELNYKTGLILREKADDPKILLPISRVDLNTDSRRMIMQIAPADYRDACSKIISDAEKEALSKWETLAQVLVFGFLGVVLLISMILVIQYSKNAMADANAMHREAMEFYEKAIGATSTRASSAP